MWKSTFNSDVQTWWEPNHFVPLVNKCFPTIAPSSSTSLSSARPIEDCQPDKRPTSDACDSEPWYCVISDEERQDEMVRCCLCGTWVHVECAGGISPNLQCDMCE